MMNLLKNIMLIISGQIHYFLMDQKVLEQLKMCQTIVNGKEYQKLLKNLNYLLTASNQLTLFKVV
jgi:hypothetical protein